MVALVALVATSLVAGTPASAEAGPTVSVGDQSGLERDSVTGSVFMPIYLSEPALEPVVVSYWTADGTATAGADYTRWGTPTSPRTATIPAGALQTQVNIPILADGLTEADETFSLIIGTATGGNVTIGDDTGTATIVDADAISTVDPAITVSNPTIIEGDVGQRRAQFLIHLSRVPTSALTVTYTTADGTATAGDDYTAKLPGTVVFAPGQISRTIDVLVNADTTADPTRSFTLDVFVTSGPAVEDLNLRGTATIIDDDPPPADTTPPALTLPDGVNVVADGPEGAVATWTATAVDDVDGPVQVGCTPSSGTLFPIGDTPVVCTAADVMGNVASGSFVVSVGPPPPVRVDKVVSGQDHTCALLEDHTVRCWGAGASGQLGNGGTTNVAAPVRVLLLQGAIDVAAGLSHTCALLDGGTVRCWGAGASGRLGNGGSTSSLEPVTVSGLTGATSIAAGANHTCATLSDGTARCWGNNTSGQLGNGTTTNSNVAVPVTGLTTVVGVAAGATNTCAVLSNGTARCWGANASGQLGNGSTAGSTTPVTVSGLTTVTDVAVGGAHSCARLADGAVRCWGRGGSGELGNFASSNASTPVVAWVNGVAAISLGDRHSCATRTDGTARCWGAGAAGQLGNGATLTAVTAPVAVTGLADATSVAAGRQHTCALLSGGSVSCWGLGASGQLGNGSTVSTSQPVAVAGLPDPGPDPTFRTVSTLAGSVDGFADGIGAEARFGFTYGIDTGPDGDVYVVSNYSVRRITPAGVVTTHAGTGERGTTEGPAAAAQFYAPTDVAVAPDGTVYVAEAVTEMDADLFGLTMVNRIKRITPAGDVSTFVGGGIGGYQDGSGLAARFYLPTSIDIGPDGNLYVADSGNNRIRRVTPDGVVTTVSSNSTSEFFGIRTLTVGSDGSIAFADDTRIQRLAGGVVSTVAGSATSGDADGPGSQARFGFIADVAQDEDGTLFVADTGLRRLRQVTPDGQVSLAAGLTDGYVDGLGASARFSSLSGLSIGPGGTVYLADSGNRRIRVAD